MNKVVSVLVLFLVLSIALFSIPDEVAGQTGTVYIKADGSVSPSSAPIQRDGDVYTLTGSITANSTANAGIIIERDNVVVDGAGFTLKGPGSSGILLTPVAPSTEGRKNVTIKNMRIEDFDYGIQLFESFNNTVSGCNITGGYTGIGIFGYLTSANNTISGNRLTNSGNGVILSSSYGNTLDGNIITANDAGGIILFSSSLNRITSNIVANNSQGIEIFSSPSLVLRNNSISDNGLNFNVRDVEVSHDVDVSNTINGKPIYFWRNERDRTVPSDAGYVALVNCVNITVENLQLSNNGQGIYLLFTTDSKVTRNAVTSNQAEGIALYNSSRNEISENSVVDNGLGMMIWDSTQNKILRNSLTENNGWGIQFRGTQKDNILYHNNFVNNKVVDGLQVSIDKRYGAGLGNGWDNGKVGNYWSDYRTRYANVTEIDHLRIGDTPFFINENNIDHFPLMDPVVLETTPPTISVTSPANKTYASDVVLSFTVNEPAPWRGYSLDGQKNVTVTGEKTLANLTEGTHGIVVYAEDLIGNLGSSDAIYFTVDKTPPRVGILSPENKTYDTNSIALNFTVDESVSWMGYRLGGQAAVEIFGNTTLAGLAYGARNITVIAKDSVGNTGTSETVHFTLVQKGGNGTEPEPFPSTWIIAGAAAAGAASAAILLYYFTKRRKHTRKTEKTASA